MAFVGRGSLVCNEASLKQVLVPRQSSGCIIGFGEEIEMNVHNLRRVGFDNFDQVYSIAAGDFELHGGTLDVTRATAIVASRLHRLCISHCDECGYNGSTSCS